MSVPTIIQMFLAQAEKYGSRDALMVKTAGKYSGISWKSFQESARNFSLGLRDLGVLHGDMVCLLSENRPEWAYADLAILSLGAVNVPIYPTSSAKEVEYILNHCGAKILILSTAEQFAKVQDIRKNCPALQKVVVLDAQGISERSVFTFEKVSSVGAAVHALDGKLYGSLCDAVRPEDLASIIYTSGTTGQPKGAMLTHGNFMSNVLASAQVLPADDRDIALSFLPLSHVFERMAGFYFMMERGATIAYAENMNTVPENLMEVRPTIMTSVPRLYEKFYARILDSAQSGSPLRQKIFSWSLAVGRAASPYRLEHRPMPWLLRCRFAAAKALVFKKIKARFGGRLRFFISGGAPLSKEIAEFFFSADVLILEGYGLTETSPVVAVNRPESIKFGTVGPPIPGVEVKIAADGEILIRGANVMKGYYQSEQETGEAIRDGWFYTGDIGELDERGFLRITDRKKELIVTSGGKNIAPQKIENLLIADKYIAQICVCGDRRNFLTALVVPDFAQIEKYARYKEIPFRSRQDLVANEQINNLIRRRIDGRSRDLSQVEKIKYFKLLPEEFSQEKGELTPTLKLKRKVVNAKYLTEIEAMYEGKSR